MKQICTDFDAAVKNNQVITNVYNNFQTLNADVQDFITKIKTGGCHAADFGLLKGQLTNIIVYGRTGPAISALLRNLKQ